MLDDTDNYLGGGKQEPGQYKSRNIGYQYSEPDQSLEDDFTVQAIAGENPVSQQPIVDEYLSEELLAGPEQPIEVDFPQAAQLEYIGQSIYPIVKVKKMSWLYGYDFKKGCQMEGGEGGGDRVEDMEEGVGVGEEEDQKTEEEKQSRKRVKVVYVEDNEKILDWNHLGNCSDDTKDRRGRKRQRKMVKVTFPKDTDLVLNIGKADESPEDSETEDYTLPEHLERIRQSPFPRVNIKKKSCQEYGGVTGTDGEETGKDTGETGKNGEHGQKRRKVQTKDIEEEESVENISKFLSIFIKF